MGAIRKWVILGVALAFLAGSTICVLADSAEQTGKQADKKAQESGDQAVKDAEKSGEDAGEAMRETGKSVGEGFKQAGKEIGGFFKGLTQKEEEKKE